jgi:AcrR family transcriptional regulator
MTPRPDVSEQRKNQIIEAAMTVFARSGFHKATMDDIAAESGLSKGTLYWYFESKDEIISNGFENFFTQEFDQMNSILLKDIPASQKLLRITDLFIADMAIIQPILSITFEYISLALRENNIRQSLYHYYHTYIEILTSIVQGGIELGEFRPVKPDDAAIAIGSVLEGSIMLWIYDPESVNLDYHTRSSVQLLIEGLSA